VALAAEAAVELLEHCKDCLMSVLSIVSTAAWSSKLTLGGTQYLAYARSIEYQRVGRSLMNYRRRHDAAANSTSACLL